MDSGLQDGFDEVASVCWQPYFEVDTEDNFFGVEMNGIDDGFLIESDD